MSTPDSSSYAPTDAAYDQAGELTRVTRAMVGIYKDQFGRGPRHASTHYTGPNAMTTILVGTLTPVERTLAGIGESQRLRELRDLFQHAAEPAFRAAVEEITGRKVLAFTSGMDTQADIATENFILSTGEDGSTSRDGASD